MTFDEALAQPGDKLQAWDLNVKDGERAVSIYAVGPAGARQLGYRNVRDEWRKKTTSELHALGIFAAETDFNCDLVWQPLDNGVVVYDSKRRVLDARGDELALDGGRVIPKPELKRIVAWAADDYVARGVKAELHSGEIVDLVLEQSLGAMGDPTYSRNELLNETEWCGSIAAALGKWAGTGSENEI